MRKTINIIIAVFFGVVCTSSAFAATELLRWKVDPDQKYYYLYGEMTALESIPGMFYANSYYRGYNGMLWQPGENHSVLMNAFWNPSGPGTDYAKTVALSSAENVSSYHFTNEGQGVRSQVEGGWRPQITHRFLVKFNYNKAGGVIEKYYFILNDRTNVWMHVSTQSSPIQENDKNGGFFNGLSSWIENVVGRADFSKTKIVAYDLWLGKNIRSLRRLTSAKCEYGSGICGVVNDRYFLAEGSPENLNASFKRLESQYGKFSIGVDKKELSHLSDKPLEGKVIEELSHISKAPKFNDPFDHKYPKYFSKSRQSYGNAD